MILWDVDTQNDFMLPDGKLYVPGAEQTLTAMKRLVEAARGAGIMHVASADDHELTDDEISDAPDLRSEGSGDLGQPLALETSCGDQFPSLVRGIINFADEFIRIDGTTLVTNMLECVGIGRPVILYEGTSDPVSTRPAVRSCSRCASFPASTSRTAVSSRG